MASWPVTSFRKRRLGQGDTVEVYLERKEDRDGQLVLSKEQADKVRRWQRVEEIYEDEEVIEGTIVRRIKGGMIVELLDGMEAFLPGSQIDVRPVRDFEAYLEKRMEFKIVKLNPENENIVVSHRELIEHELEEQRQQILEQLEVGQVLQGTVKNIVDFGVFIDLGGVDGLSAHHRPFRGGLCRTQARLWSSIKSSRLWSSITKKSASASRWA